MERVAKIKKPVFVIFLIFLFFLFVFTKLEKNLFTGKVIDLLKGDYFSGTILLVISVVLLLIYLDIKKAKNKKKH